MERNCIQSILARSPTPLEKEPPCRPTLDETDVISICEWCIPTFRSRVNSSLYVYMGMYKYIISLLPHHPTTSHISHPLCSKKEDVIRLVNPLPEVHREDTIDKLVRIACFPRWGGMRWRNIKGYKLYRQHLECWIDTPSSYKQTWDLSEQGLPATKWLHREIHTSSLTFENVFIRGYIETQVSTGVF